MCLSPHPVENPDILVVDDDWDTAASLACLLGLFGHRVQVARDGYQAIEMALRHRPRHVLLDLALRGLDGYQVASRLREEVAGLMVLVAITGHDQEHRGRALASGFDHFFLKPIEREALSDLLAVLDDGSRDRPADPPSTAGANAHRPAADSRPPDLWRIGGPAVLRAPPRSDLPSTGMGRDGVSVSSSRRRVEIINALGLHLRAADRIVRLARQFRSDVRVGCGGRRVSSRSILDLVTLAAERGTWLELEADGPDAEKALDALTGLIRRGFDE